eukprot:scaffold1953_cov176-Amphora_coffeaeformis.AAC.53
MGVKQNQSGEYREVNQRFGGTNVRHRVAVFFRSSCIPVKSRPKQPIEALCRDIHAMEADPLSRDGMGAHRHMGPSKSTRAGYTTRTPIANIIQQIYSTLLIRHKTHTLVQREEGNKLPKTTRCFAVFQSGLLSRRLLVGRSVGLVTRKHSTLYRYYKDLGMKNLICTTRYTRTGRRRDTGRSTAIKPRCCGR